MNIKQKSIKAVFHVSLRLICCWRVSSLFLRRASPMLLKALLLQSIITQLPLQQINIDKQMINTSFCSETFPQYGYNPSFGLYFLAESNHTEQAHSIQTHLEKQVAELKQQTANLSRLVQELKRQLEQKKKGGKKSKANKIKKVYSKDRQCPHENCDKRYSSKIALNAHIKKVHEKQPQDSSEYVF